MSQPKRGVRAMFFAVVSATVLLSPRLIAAELGGGAVAEIDYSQARQQALQAIQKFRVAPGFEVSLFAHEPQLRNPVAFCLDEQGRIYVSETGRYRSSALDIRHYMDWYLDDLACRTVEDRVAMIRKHLGDDYQKLGVETETIRLLEDQDRDGVADRSQVYAEEFKGLLDGIASGVLARKGEVYFTNIPHLWKLRDGNDDGVADERESLSYGYGVRFSLTGHDLHGLKFGPDGRLYFTVGDRGADVTTQEGTRLSYPDEGICFRCNPDGSELEVFARGLRNPQELAFNEYGDLFTGENDCDHGDRERWVHIVEGGDSGWRVGYQFSEQKPGGVWNAEGLWYLRFPGQAAYLLPPLAHIDNGPSGLAYYPGTGLPDIYRGHFFLCHFKGLDTVSGIKMFSLQPDGASYSMGPVKELIWNVMPTDVDFGPDGYIYLTDWVEGWPKSERGRVYRLHHPDTVGDAVVRETQRYLAEGMDHRSEKELVELIAHSDMRVRQEAQFEFADRGRGMTSILVDVARKHSSQFARIHALWALSQVARGTKGDPSVLQRVVSLLSDSDAEIRAQTAKILEDSHRPESTARALEPLLGDESSRVRYCSAMSLGRLQQASSVPALIRMLRENDDRDLYLRHAAVVALDRIGDRQAVLGMQTDDSRAVRMASLLVLRRWEDSAIATYLSDAEPLLVVEAARAINDVPIAGAMSALANHLSDRFDMEAFRSSSAPEADLVTPYLRRALNANYRLGGQPNLERVMALAAATQFPESFRAEALQRMGQWAEPSPRDQVVGLYRPLSGVRVSEYGESVASELESLFAESSISVAEAAVDAAGRLGLKSLSSALAELVASFDPAVEVRVAALEALARLGTDQFQTSLDLARNDFSVELRKAATRLSANVDPSVAAPQLNAVMVNGTLEEQQIALATLATMGGSVADEIILRWLGRVVDGTAPEGLALDVVDAAEAREDARIIEGLDKWRDSIPENDPLGELRIALEGGDSATGRRVFLENPVASCTRCHRYGEIGSDVGPGMDGIGGKLSREQLLEAIVYPNRSVAEGFETLVVTLEDETVHAGILKEETDEELVLNTVESGLVRIPKTEIESRDQGLSGMPEGLSELLSRQDLRDLVAFLASEVSAP